MEFDPVEYYSRKRRLRVAALSNNQQESSTPPKRGYPGGQIDFVEFVGHESQPQCLRINLKSGVYIMIEPSIECNSTAIRATIKATKYNPLPPPKGEKAPKKHKGLDGDPEHTGDWMR